jgi:hypothetical protein
MKPEPFIPCNTSEAACRDCHLSTQLKCRFTSRDLFHFLIRAFGFILPAGIGLVVSGAVWAATLWVGYMLFFFSVWEIRILCSHCPYYAEDSKVLHCIANHGSPKLWKYRPQPMNRAEKFQLWIGFGLFTLFPLGMLINGKAWWWLLAALAGWLIFARYLTTRVCTRCINLSCPLNRVPKHIAQAYLDSNAAMRQVWKNDHKPTQPGGKP